MQNNEEELASQDTINFLISGRYARCDVCGKFISVYDFQSGKASCSFEIVRSYVQAEDDAHYDEEYEMKCKRCNKSMEGKE